MNVVNEYMKIANIVSGIIALIALGIGMYAIHKDKHKLMKGISLVVSLVGFIVSSMSYSILQYNNINSGVQISNSHVSAPVINNGGHINIDNGKDFNIEEYIMALDDVAGEGDVV